MPARPRRSTALLDDPGMPGASDLDQDATPARRGPGRPRKATGAAPAKRAGRKPGTVSIAARDSGGKIMSVQQMKDEVAGELGMLLTLGVAGLELRDPDMAQAFLEPISLGRLGEVEPIEGFVDRVVNLLARNHKALAYAAKGGIITDIGVAAFLAVTVARRCSQVSAYRRENGEGGLNDDQFPVYQGAGAPA
jgi:hypothetical protein